VALVDVRSRRDVLQEADKFDASHDGDKKSTGRMGEKYHEGKDTVNSGAS